MAHLKYILSLTLLFSTEAFARDITPEEKLGELEIQNVDSAKLSPEFSLKDFSMAFFVDAKSSPVEFGVANTVAAGVGCLQVTYKPKNVLSYQATQCGIKVDEKKLTRVQLAAVQYNWNSAQYDVDFGPSPRFYFSPTDEVNNRLDFSSGIHTGASRLEQPLFLIPAMDLQAQLFHDHTGALFTKKTIVRSGDVLTENLDTQELRGTLLLDFIDGKPKYAEGALKNYIHAAYWRHELDAKYSHTAPGNNDVLNYHQFQNDGVTQRAFAFPLVKNVKGALYEVSINEHLIKPTLESGKVFRIPVATLNVNDYRSSMPGTFKVYSNKNKKGPELSEHLHPVLRQNYSPYLAEAFFPTKTSLFFPIGHLFRLDFYALDDLGRNVLQDQIMVDLTTENSPSLY